MKLGIGVVSLACLGFGLGVPAVAHAADTGLPATLATALEGAELDTADGWAFRQTQTVQALNEPAMTAVTRWDPSKPAGEQCTVVSVTKEGKPAKDEDPCEGEHDRELYGELVPLLEDALIETVSEDDQLAVYRIEPKDRDHGFSMGGLHVDIGDDDSKNLLGTVNVVKAGPGAPYVERVAFTLKEPSGNMLAKLKRLDIVYTYAPDLLTGAKLLQGLDVNLNLTVITFFNVTTDVSMRFDEYRRLK
jgi:hypothetical protein